MTTIPNFMESAVLDDQFTDMDAVKDQFSMSKQLNRRNKQREELEKHLDTVSKIMAKKYPDDAQISIKDIYIDMVRN